MAKLTRVTGKVFGGSAPLDEIGQFGSALAGNPTNTQDVATIQALDAYSEGWGSAVISSRQFPPIEEVTGALKTISYQGCYLLQEGIPEYDIDTEYSNTSIVKSINDGITTLYVSLSNGNKGNALSNATYWKPYVLDQIQRNIGEIVTSTIPLTDAGLHLLDGALLQYGSYQAFINYIAELYDSGDYDDLFETEANWQSSVSTYGTCGKFVYDSVNNTVRLPKITGIVEGTTDVTALGNLIQAGLPSLEHRHYNGVVDDSSQIWPVLNQWGKEGCANGGYNTYTGYTSTQVDVASPIYGRSNTVQPQTIKVLYYIVVSTSAKTDIQVDIDEIATDLNGKADVDLTNVSNSGTSLSAGWAMPSLTTRTVITIGASDATYTAPADGFLFLRVNCGTGISYTTVYQNQWADQRVYDQNYISVSMMVQVAKGNYSINYGNVTFVDAYFVYAKGSENEASST